MREELNRLVKNISFDHNYNKFYICERRKIYLNNMKLIGRSIDVIKRHNCFMSDGDAGFILSVIKLMKSNGIDDVYFEIKNILLFFLMSLNLVKLMKTTLTYLKKFIRK